MSTVAPSQTGLTLACARVPVVCQCHGCRRRRRLRRPQRRRNQTSGSSHEASCWQHNLTELAEEAIYRLCRVLERIIHFQLPVVVKFAIHRRECSQGKRATSSWSVPSAGVYVDVDLHIAMTRFERRRRPRRAPLVAHVANMSSVATTTTTTTTEPIEAFTSLLALAASIVATESHEAIQCVPSPLQQVSPATLGGVLGGRPEHVCASQRGAAMEARRVGRLVEVSLQIGGRQLLRSASRRRRRRCHRRRPHHHNLPLAGTTSVLGRSYLDGGCHGARLIQQVSLNSR